MAYPVPVVEIAFDASPYDATPATWTNVTQWVRSATVDRGRSDDWSTLEGSASVLLDNRDRRFDPFNASSPYAGKLNPRKQIRIRATYGGTTYDVFRGFISGFPPQWTDAGFDSTVELSCFDALQLLGSSSLPADWSRDYILSTSPRHYYPCDEPIISFTANQVLKDYGSFPLNLSTTAAVTSGGELAVGLPSRSVQGQGQDAAIALGSPILAGTVDFSFACWAVLDGNANGSVGCTIGNAGAYISYNPTTSKFEVIVSDNYSGLIRTYVTGQTYDSGTPRFFAFSWNATTKTLQLWIDGVLTTTTVTTAGAIIIILFESVSIGAAQAQAVMAWNRIITQAEVQNIYNYSTANFPETTAARMTRIIQETPFPTALISTPTSPASSVLDITNDAPTASSELQKVADSENAPLFVSKSGVVTLFNQNQIRTQTKSIVSQATYGTGGLAIGTEIALQYDGDSMRNVANVEMSGGGVYIKTNSSSVTAYGEAEQYVSTQVSSIADAEDIGQIVSAWGGNVYPKSSPVDVVLSSDASWASTLGLELFDRFTLNVTPPTGSAINVPMLTQRISHDITPERWSTTLEGSARWAAVFIIGQSLIGGTDLLA